MNTNEPVWDLTSYDPYNKLGEHIHWHPKRTKLYKHFRLGYSIFAVLTTRPTPALARRQAG